MNEITSLVIGVVVLLLGIPIGDFIAKLTKEELDSGRKWFKSIISVSIIGGFISLIFKNDVLLFAFFFIAIVTSRSLKKPSRETRQQDKKNN